jgi:hypothetical protein
MNSTAGNPVVAVTVIDVAEFVHPADRVVGCAVEE